jgi:hypothetical protein
LFKEYHQLLRLPQRICLSPLVRWNIPVRLGVRSHWTFDQGHV